MRKTDLEINAPLLRSSSDEPTYHAELMEPRVLLSAELGMGLDAQSPTQFSLFQQDDQKTLEDLVALTERNAVDTESLTTYPTAIDLDALRPYLDEHLPEAGSDLSDYLLPNDEKRHELIFVDTNTADYELLVEDIRASEDKGITYEIIYINADDNGMQVIADALQERTNIDAIHLVSHGEEGRVKLGNVWLTNDNVDDYSALIAGWSLEAGADLLIYGCNLGRDAEGLSLIDQLALMTGADVAASDDLTGAESLQADWDLEISTGPIETRLPFSEALIAGWAHVLAPPTTAGIADVDVSQGAGDTVVDLLVAFSDVENADSDLIYSIDANTNTALFDSVSIDLAANTLTLAFDDEVYGTSDVTIKATDLDGDTVTTTFTVNVTPEATLILSTDGDALVPGAGLAAWNNGEIVQLGGTAFTLGGTTAGSFSLLGDIGEAIDGLHYVNVNLTLGTSNTIAVQPGDLLISLSSNATLISTGAVPEVDLSVTRTDIVLVRPDVVGDYSKVNYFMLLDNVAGGVEGLSLVEEDTIVGDTLLTAGEILIAPGTRDVNVYTPANLLDASSGTTEVLIDGDDLRDSSGSKMINRFIAGVELVENSMVVGGVTVNSGNLLLSVESNSASVFGKDGVNPDTTLSVTEFDIFLADVTRSSIGADALEGTATLLLEGGDLGLSDSPNKEDINALSILTSAPAGLANAAPVGVADVFVVGQGASLNLTDTTTFVVANDTDTDGDTLGAVLLTMPANSTAFTFNTDGSFSYTHDGVGVISDSFTYAVGDGKGGISTATVTININPAGNNAPTAISLTDTASYNEGDASVDLANIVVADIDVVPVQSITATLTLSDVSTGVLTTSGAATYNAATGVWTITDTLVNVNLALANVSFTPGVNNDLDTTITTHIEDQDGAGPADGVITLDVTPINDPPTATNLTTTSAYNEGDASVTITDIAVSDSDTNPAQTITATLTLSDVTTGVLTTSGAATYNAGTGVWTISDTLANVNAALAALSFTPVAGNDKDATVTTHIEDQDGAGPADGVITLDVTPINDPPTATNLTTTSAYNEGDASVTITDIAVSDSDTNPAQTITATLTLSDVTTGVLTTSGAATYNAGTGVWTISDTLANVNAALAALSFTPVAGNDKDATVTTHIEDQDGAGPADGVITLDVTPINDPPTATNLTTTSAYNEGDASVTITDIAVSDSDTNPAQTITATLTLSDVTTGVLTTSGAATYNAGTGVWTISDTLANVNAALAALSFTPVAGNDKDATVTTHIEDQDGAGPADGVITLDVTPINDPPTATNLTTTSAYNEGDASVTITDIAVSDSDTNPAQTITATLTLSDVTTGVLTTSGAATYNAGTGVWTISDTLANVNAALAALSFTPVADNDKDATVTTHIEDQDGAGPADGVITLDVTPINDPPTATNLTTTSAYNEGDASVTITDIAVSDSDTNPAQTITATLTLSDVTTGVLTTSGAATYNAGTGVWTISDTLANVNAALAALSFTPVAGNDKDATVTTHIEDQDGAGPADGVITLDVTPINDPPTATNLTTTSAYNEGDASVTITDIAVSDSDTNPAQTITATLTLSDVTTGVLTTSGAATYNAGTGVWTISDTLANVNAALAALSFTPVAGNDKDATVTTHIEDQDGAGPADGVITLDVTPINDPPTATNLTTTSAYNEGDASVTITDIAVSDSDTNPAQTITATLTLSDVTTGVLTTSGAATYNAGTGVWTISDTLANVNAALAALSFTPVAGNDKDATVTTHIEDQDGAGPADGAITLDVTPINDPPTATNLTTTSAYNEGDASVSITDIAVSDSDTNPAQTITATLTLSDVTTGVLTTSGAATYNAGTGVWTISDTLANVNAALAALSFTPVAGNDKDATVTTHIEDQDGAGPADGAITLDVTPINDPPTATNLTTISGYNVGDATVVLTDVVVSDSDTNPAQTITATLTLSDVTTGVLTTSGAATYNAATGVWTITDTLVNVNSALANVSFTPIVTNVLDASITTHIEDQNGAGPADGVISLDVVTTNSAPTAANNSVTMAEDNGHIFVSSDFQFADPDAGDTLTSVRVTTLESIGRLTLSGADVALNQTISIADINAGLLVFTPAANGNGDSYAQFDFSVNDGTADSTSSYTMTMDVTATNDAPTGTLTIMGDAQEGETLNADVSSIEDADGRGVLNYQWLRGGVVIPGAVSASYSTINDDVDQILSLELTYVDDGGTTEVLSASIGPVSNVNDLPLGAPVVTGLLKEGETLIVDTTTVTDDDGVGTLSYQWQRDGQDIPGAVSNSYLLLPADADSIVSVTVSYVDDNGTSESLSSDSVGPIEGINDAPVSSGLSGILVDEDSADSIIDVSVGFEDPDEDTLSYFVSGVSNSALFENVLVNAAGILTLDYADNVSGLSEISIQASDPSGETATTTFTVTVSPVVDLPMGVEDVANAAEDGNGAIFISGVLQNDSAGDAGDLSIVEIISGGVSVGPGQVIVGDAGGTFVVGTDGGVNFDPGNDFQALGVGQTQVTTVIYVAEDADGNVISVPIRVTVFGANDPVTAQDDDWSVASGEIINANANLGLLSNDRDIDIADSLMILSLSNGSESFMPGERVPGSSGGIFVVFSDGSFTFEPGTDFIGLPQGQSATTTLDYDVTDNRGSVRTATLTVNVAGATSQIATETNAGSATQPIATSTAATSGTSDTGAATSPSNNNDASESVAAQNAENSASNESENEEDEDSEEEAASDEENQDELSPELQTVFSSRVVDDVALGQFQGEISVSDQLSSTVAQVLSVDINAFSGLDSLTLQGLDARESAGLIGTTDSLILISSPDYSRSLDESRATVQQSAAEAQTVKGGSLTISAGISIGYVIYLIRSGVILSSVLTALPAWRLIDPLPILGQFSVEDDGDGESIEEIVQAGAESANAAEIENVEETVSDESPEGKPHV